MTFDEWMNQDVDGKKRYKTYRIGSGPLREVWNAATAQFNTTFQHEPPKIGDTKWIRVVYAGRQAPMVFEGDDDWMTE